MSEGAVSSLSSPASRGLAPGEGRIRCEASGNLSRVVELGYRAPLRLFELQLPGHIPTVVATQLGGGFVGADHLYLNLSVGEGASLCLGATAHGKAYAGSTGGQKLAANVGEGATLLSLTPPLCPFEGSESLQHSEYELADGGSLLHGELILCGRQARGEVWKAKGLRTGLRVKMAGRMVLVDNTELGLIGGEAPPRELGTVGQVVGAGPALEGWRAEMSQLEQPRASLPGARDWTLSRPRPDLLAVRFFASTAQGALQAYRHLGQMAEEWVGRDPLRGCWS